MWDNDWWTSGNAETEIKAELDEIKAHANTVRIFVDYSTFGGPTINTTQRSRLANIIKWIGERDMKAIVTLFDGLSNIDPDQWANHKSHLDGLVDYFKSNKNIRFWDLRNEFTIQPGEYNYKQREVWIREMLLKVKSIDTLHPCTAQSDAAGSQWCSDCFDLLASHLYKPNAEDNQTEVDNLYSSTHTHKGRPYYCGETGRNTYDYTEAQAKAYLQTTFDGLATRDCGIGLWCLNVYTDLGEGAEKYFGILDKNAYYFWKGHASPFLNYIPTYQGSPRIICNDAWTIINDTQTFNSELGLTEISGIWNRVDEGDGRGYVATQTDDSNLTSESNPCNLKSAVTIASLSNDHFIIRSEVKLTQLPEIGVLFNYTDLRNSYRVYLYKDNGTQVFALKRIKDGVETLLTEQNISLSLDTWYTITVHVHENTYSGITYKNIRVFLNNGAVDILVEYNDSGSSRLTGGKAGIYTGGAGKGRFNDYNVDFISKTRTYQIGRLLYFLDKDGKIFKVDPIELNEEASMDMLQNAKIDLGIVDLDKVG